MQNIDEVQHEYRYKPQDNPVDYGLFRNATPRLFAEAKSVETDLTDRKWILQNVNYANAAGVEWCVLTNGDEYRIYNSHAPVEVEQKLFRSVRVSDNANAGQVIDTLSLRPQRSAEYRGAVREPRSSAHPARTQQGQERHDSLGPRVIKACEDHYRFPGSADGAAEAADSRRQRPGKPKAEPPPTKPTSRRSPERYARTAETARGCHLAGTTED
jgi:hypothetical protein